MKGICGVGYDPHAVATQVIEGVNYCFLCKGIGIYPGAHDFAVKVYIYKPLAGDPHITHIERVEP